MKTNVCFVYPWATFGGCERVFINRALAFKYYLPNTSVDFFFMQDAGGLEAFRLSLEKYGLNEKTAIVSSLDKKYDLVCLVDCPQAIDLCLKKSINYIIECHTPYPNNRKYLAKLPSGCKYVVTPSFTFSKLIKKEFPSLSNIVTELRNFVPWDIPSHQTSIQIELPYWSRKPILFFSRMDKLKDPLSLLNAFEVLENKRKGEFMLLLCGPLSHEIDIKHEISKRELNGMTVLLPPVPFSSGNLLMSSIAHRGGIFVSPSKGESFGLSAAEAISATLPVALSNIKPHIDLVGEFQSIFTYTQGNHYKLAECIESLFDNYEDARAASISAREAFSATAFIKDWKSLLNKLGFSA